MKKKPASNPRAIAKRRRVITRLETQLKNGIKAEDVPLTDKDRERIGKELDILKKRL